MQYSSSPAPEQRVGAVAYSVDTGLTYAIPYLRATGHGIWWEVILAFHVFEVAIFQSILNISWAAIKDDWHYFRGHPMGPIETTPSDNLGRMAWQGDSGLQKPALSHSRSPQVPVPASSRTYVHPNTEALPPPSGSTVQHVLDICHPVPGEDYHQIKPTDFNDNLTDIGLLQILRARYLEIIAENWIPVFVWTWLVCVKWVEINEVCMSRMEHKLVTIDPLKKRLAQLPRQFQLRQVRTH